MADQSIRLETHGRSEHDIATELTKALIDKGIITSVDEAVEAFQEIFNVAHFAYGNKEDPFEESDE